jgi:hypothetical protein
MPDKKRKKIADLPKKAVNSRKAEAVKGGQKLRAPSKLRKAY